MRNEHKLFFIAFVFIGAVGFSTGIHYQRIIDLNTLSVAKGCFEWGILALMNGEKIGKCLIESIISVLKHFFIMAVGVLNWLTFLLVPLEIFCISFKTGICMSFFIKNMMTVSIFEKTAVSLFLILMMLASVVFAAVTAERRTYHMTLRGFDLTDKKAILFGTLLTLCTVLCAVLFVVWCAIPSNAIYGVLNTIL